LRSIFTLRSVLTSVGLHVLSWCVVVSTIVFSWWTVGSVSSVGHLLLVHVVVLLSLIVIAIEVSIVWWVVHGLSSVWIHAHVLSIVTASIVVSLLVLLWAIIVRVDAVWWHVVASWWTTMLALEVSVFILVRRIVVSSFLSSSSSL